MSVIGVGALPAAMVAGEKVAVAPVGRPLALKVNVSGKVDAPLGVKVRVKVASAPAVTVADPELELVPDPEESAKPGATVKLEFAVAGA